MPQNKRNAVFVINMILVCLVGNLCLIDGAQAAGITIYVDDSNTGGPWNGTQDHPYRTIHDA